MRRVQIYDTTLRDGAQAEGISFSLHDKLLLAERLDSLGFDFIEGGYPGSNATDAEFFRRTNDLTMSNAAITAFGMTRRKGGDVRQDSGLQVLLDSGVSTITLVGKSSAFQVSEILQADLDENLSMIAESVALLHEAGRKVIFDAEHFFDGWKVDPDYSMKALEAAVEAGAQAVVPCDTNGGSMPELVAEATRAVVERLSVPVGIHCHNDCGLAVANTLAAIDAGASQAQGTINGFGERCGNADLIAVIANLAAKKSRDQRKRREEGVAERAGRLEKENATDEEKTRAGNSGILLSSGFIAGESLTAVALAFLVLGGDFYPPLTAIHEKIAGSISPRFWPSLIIYPVLAYLLVWTPINRMRGNGTPVTKVE